MKMLQVTLVPLLNASQDMVLRAGSTAPTPRSPAGLTAGGNIPWAHE